MNNITKTKQAALKNDTLEMAQQPVYNVLVVGYRENPNYFRNCLNSIKHLSFHKLYVVIDGCMEEDQYMVDIVKEVFLDTCCHIILDQLKFNLDLVTIKEKLSLINPCCNVVCISQPHSGKRNVMYTGFYLSITNDPQAKYIVCTDSDTILDSRSASLMCNLMSRSESIGGIAGNLGIFDKYSSFITFMSSIRYWFAFNVERAYQSYNNYVLCISGPIGLYHTSILEKVMDDWKTQMFLGQQCTYGDDRHLTNKILSQGYQVMYLPSARALTETPSTIYTFYKQQTRWSKSAYREMLWTVSSVHKHSVFMSVDLTYTLLYPFFVMGYLLYVLYAGSAHELALYLSIIMFFGLIKSMYGAILGNSENIFYFAYTLVYLCVVFPAKLWALLTLTDISWGTPFRKTLVFSSLNIQADAICLVVWNLTLLGGLAFNCARNANETTFLMVILLIWIVLFVGVYCYTYLKKYNSNKKLM